MQAGERLSPRIFRRQSIGCGELDLTLDEIA
jgi:hypothetical protein